MDGRKPGSLLHPIGRGLNVFVQNGPSFNPILKGKQSPSGVVLSFSLMAMTPQSSLHSNTYFVLVFSAFKEGLRSGLL